MPTCEHQYIAESSRPEALSSAMRLDFVDGMRALCALYIVMYHCVGAIEDFRTLPQWLQVLTRQLSYYGHEMVAVFIVLRDFA